MRQWRRRLKDWQRFKVWAKGHPDDPELRKWLRLCWLTGGVLAVKSLKQENLAQAEETNELVLPSAELKEGTDFLLRMIDSAPSAELLIDTTCHLAVVAVASVDVWTELEKRMVFRQTVIAAGWFIGQPDLAQEMAVDYEEALLLLISDD